MQGKGRKQAIFIKNIYWKEMWLEDPFLIQQGDWEAGGCVYVE